MIHSDDLTKDEQANVRVALRFIRARCGGSWTPVSKILRFKATTLADIDRGDTVSASLAFRVARFAKVGVDDLLAGTYPPAGTCPYCGHCKGIDDVNGR